MTTDGVRGGSRGVPPPRGRSTFPAILPDPYRYSMSDLERETGFNSRTVRFYISQGLLPPAHGRGPTATYDLGHLLRLRMVQNLKAEYLPLGDIKERLGDLTDDEIAAILDIQTRPAEDRWRRVQLHPDIELHVRERSGKSDRALEEAVELIIGTTRPIIDRLEGHR